MISRFRSDAAGAFLFCLLAFTAAAQQSTVELRAPAQKLIETAPGRIVTTSIVVANRAAEAEEFDDRIVLPAGCQRVAPPLLPFRLEGGAETLRVLAIFVPQKVPAGDHEISYAVQSRRDPSLNSRIAIALHVTPIERLELAVEAGPSLVIAGDTYKVRLRVTNGGNSPLDLRLAAHSSLDLPLQMEPGACKIEPLATREIVCRVRTPMALAQHANHAVTFDLTALTPSGRTLAAKKASLVEIIPVVTGNRDPHHYLPVQYTTTVLAEERRAPQVQVAISGSGSLDEAGKQRVDFILRGGDVQTSSGFGEHDEYGASYRGETWEADAGDRVYALSPLTEKHTFARGAAVRWHEGDNAAGVFYARTRFRHENTEELGAFVRHEFTPTFSLQANALRKSGGENLFTLGTHFAFGKLIDARVEAGASANDDGTSDVAYRIDARGQLPGDIRYTLEHTHAGKNFHGYYASSDTVNATVSKTFSPRFRVNASLTRYEGNPAVNDYRSTVVNREEPWRAGAVYSLDRHTDLSLEAQHLARADILLPAAYDFREDFARLGVGHSFGALRVRGSVDLGVFDNSLTGDSGDLQRYSFSANWQPTRSQSYGFLFQYGPSPFTGSTERTLNAGLSAQWRLAENFDASVSYTHNEFDARTGQEQDLALASLRYRFADERSLALLARWSTAPNDAAVMLQWSIPFGAAVSRKKSIGAVHGKVFDPSAGERGLERVIVQAGDQYAVTDSKGGFEFPALKPGAAELRVVENSLGRNFTMANQRPLTVQVAPAATANVSLAVAPAATLAIHVVRYAFADEKSIGSSGELRTAGGMEGAVVEISNGHDTWRARTDSTGTATFDRLASGPWKMRVAADLPPLHRLDDPERTVTLPPGGNENVTVRVLPQRRTMRVLETGTIR